MIRQFETKDLEKVAQLLAANDLPPECMPDLMIKDKNGNEIPNPLFIVKRVLEHDGQIAMMCFLKVRSELYFFIDHSVADAEGRWEMLKEFTEDMKHEAWHQGFDQMTAFVPRDLEKSFEKRLLDLGFVKSPWQSYSMNIGD
jgi:hypothetical protein